MQRPRNPLLAFLFIVALLLPWLVFLFLPGGAITGHVLFWLAMFFCLLLIWMVSAAQRRLAAVVGPDLGPRMSGRRSVAWRCGLCFCWLCLSGQG